MFSADDRSEVVARFITLGYRVKNRSSKTIELRLNKNLGTHLHTTCSHVSSQQLQELTTFLPGPVLENVFNCQLLSYIDHSVPECSLMLQHCHWNSQLFVLRQQKSRYR